MDDYGAKASSSPLGSSSTIVKQNKLSELVYFANSHHRHLLIASWSSLVPHTVSSCVEDPDASCWCVRSKPDTAICFLRCCVRSIVTGHECASLCLTSDLDHANFKSLLLDKSCLAAGEHAVDDSPAAKWLAQAHVACSPGTARTVAATACSARSAAATACSARPAAATACSARPAAAAGVAASASAIPAASYASQRHHFCQPSTTAADTARVTSASTAGGFGKRRRWQATSFRQSFAEQIPGSRLEEPHQQQLKLWPEHTAVQQPYHAECNCVVSLSRTITWVRARSGASESRCAATFAAPL